MERPSRPERLLVAALLAAVLVVDAVAFAEVGIAVVTLGGILVVVLVVGAFDPMAESVSFQISVFAVCVLLTGYALIRGRLVLGGIAALSAVAAGWMGYSDRRTARLHES